MYLIIVLIYFQLLIIFFSSSVFYFISFLFLLFLHSALLVSETASSKGFGRNVFLITRATQKEEGTTSLKQIH